MRQRVWFKRITLANFIAGVLLLVWLSCARSERAPAQAEPAASAETPVAPLVPPAAAEPTGAPSGDAAPPPAGPVLASLDEIVRCLEGGGGVQSDRCLTPAAVKGLSDAADLNDHYFAASKAMVIAQPKTPAKLVEDVARMCGHRAPPPQAQAVQGVDASQAQVVSAPAVADPMPCVLAELARRTSAAP